MQSAVLDALRQRFRPEFLNRIDEVIIFHSLGMEELMRIVDIQLQHLGALLDDRDITIEVTRDAKRHLVEEGYDPVYGARPLKRVIQRRLQDPLALKLLEGDFEEGDRISVDVRAGKFVFEKAENPQ